MIAGRAVVFGLSVPTPDLDSGSKRTLDHMLLLQESGWQVTLVTSQRAHAPRHVRDLEGHGIAVFQDDEDACARLLGAGGVQVALFVSWLSAELYLPTVRRLSPSTRAIIDSVDLHFVRNARQILGSANGALLDGRYAEELTAELNTYAAADAVLTVSDKEARLIGEVFTVTELARVVPDNEELPLCARPFDERQGVLFVGSYRHPPNVEAAAFLCTEIVPRLSSQTRAHHPVYIVGDGLGESLRARIAAVDGVRVVGWVPQLEPYFERARICVLPLLSGAGTKRKLIQALMLGTPVVSTSIGTEGFEVVDGREVLIADDAEWFATRMEQLLTDRPLWSQLAINGREQVVRTHGRENAQRALLEAVEAARGRQPKGPRLKDVDLAHHRRRVDQRYQELLAIQSAADRKLEGAS
jgi:glycosyltransferase involved in cell wall biosynthesis